SVVNLWISPRRPGQSTHQHLAESNMNLGILAALRLQRAWRGGLNIATICDTEEEVIEGRVHLERLRDLCRIPAKAKTHVLVGNFADDDILTRVPMGDLQVLGVSNMNAIDFMQRTVHRMRSSVLFVRDSGLESALA
ncbi:MAG: sodium transporter, partial [Gemmatimonadota bacterium]|nr:sodium transporter [Gemmatimonadota bacterium]